MLTVVKDHCKWGPSVIQWLSDTACLRLSLSVRINIRYRNLSSSNRNFTPKRLLYTKSRSFSVLQNVIDKDVTLDPSTWSRTTIEWLRFVALQLQTNTRSITLYSRTASIARTRAASVQSPRLKPSSSWVNLELSLAPRERPRLHPSSQREEATSETRWTND